MAINKQPLFAGTPIMNCITINPPIIEDNGKTVNGSWGVMPTLIYETTSTYGAIIDRITISATADTLNTDVTAKLIYLYLYDGTSDKYSLYKTLAMPEATLSDTTPILNPEIELTFQGGLLLKLNDLILIGASNSRNNTGREGDYLSITIEGGTYTAQ